MKRYAWFPVMTAVITIAIVAGCGGNPNYKSLRPGEMHAEGNFDGVYHSEAYGRMELTVNGDAVVGLYEGERHFGKVEGTVDGDLMLFKWYQWNEDLNGKVRQSSGHGYFRYVVVQEGTAENPRLTHFLKGEWGYGEDNAGNPWEAVKHMVAKKTLQPHDTGTPSNTMDKDFESATAVDGSAPAKPAAGSKSDLDAPTESPKDKNLDNDVRSLF